MTNDRKILGASLGLMLSTLVGLPCLAVDTATSTDSASDSEAAKPSTLWTTPKYAVKPVPQKTTVKDAVTPEPYGSPDIDNTKKKSNDPLADAVKSVPDTGTIKTSKRSGKRNKKVEAEKTSEYDAAAAQSFEKGATQPQYIWSRTAQTKAPTTADSSTQAMDDYNKNLSDKIFGNLKVPSRANLVESSDKKYNYLIGFSLLKSGQVTNVQVLNQAGTLSTVPLADDQENSMIVQALSTAIKKSAPIAKPPTGVGPWNMVVAYDVTTGKMFTALLNR